MIRRNPVQINVASEGLKQLSKSIETMRRCSLYVGIPAGGKTDARSDGTISNSDLGWIHEYGTSDGRIPPRPFLVPSVRQSKSKIVKEFEKAMQAALHGEEDRMERILEKLGLETEAAVREYILDSSHFVPLKPASILGKRSVQSARTAEELARRIAMAKPLIDTGSLMRSITSIVVEE